MNMIRTRFYFKRWRSQGDRNSQSQ